MALLATAQPVPAASWDEQIVPALRKRLEAESRMLTKRMSMISAHSGDEGGPPTSSTRGGIPEFGRSPVEPNERWRPPESPLEKARASPVATRPSAIPRPSLQYSRRGEPEEQPSPTSKQRPKRARTQSTPGLHNLPTPVSSRSNSPAVAMNPKPSRIPTATSTAKLGPASPSVPAVPRLPNGARQASNKGYPPSPDTSPDLFPIPAAGQRSKTMPLANSSRSSFEDQRGLHPKQSTEIIHEPPPFATAYEPGRLSFSNDEGERPFEHWYRGESRRNGGVGEVKVSTKEEMLNIATFGHRIGVSPASSSSLQGRRRAGTVSHRESWYMDDDALRSASGVLDEQPLTDLETSNLSEFSASSPNSQAATPRYPPMDLSGRPQDMMQFDLELDRRPSNMSLAASHTPSHASRSASRQQQYEQLGVGGPRNQPSDTSLRVNTVVANNNGPSGASRRSPMSPAQQVAANAQRIRGASAQQQQVRRGPAKQKPRSKSQPGLSNSAEDSIEYEMDAIPVWTQPKANGNWDDVVLPAVAKKMGLVENYEQTDGTPRPKKRESSERIPPAPGTFGFDDSKYRPATHLQLDEFGRPGAVHDPHHTSGESEEERRQTEPILRPISPGAMRRGRSTAEPPPSPAPFSSYQNQPRPLQPPRMASQNSMQYSTPQPMVQAAPPPPPPERFVLEKKQEEESGCCSCVIM